MGLLKSLFRGTKGFSAATNALLAEHVLGTLTVGEKDNVRKQIEHIFRAGGSPNISDDFIFRKFNRETRAVQLNLVAMALNDLGIFPPFEGEFWHEVRNPFRAGIVDSADIEAVQERLLNQHGSNIQIKNGTLQLMEL